MSNNALIRSLELLSDNKSFTLGTWIQDAMWLLMHFNHLHISRCYLQYQVNRTRFTESENNSPIRTMRKKHHNTSELLKYLDDRSYTIVNLDIQFHNGWRITANPMLIIYTNSTNQRDMMLDKLMKIAGIPMNDYSKLQNNIYYAVDLFGNLSEVQFDDFAPKDTPDEFWTEKQITDWRQKTHSNRQKGLKI